MYIYGGFVILQDKKHECNLYIYRPLSHVEDNIQIGIRTGVYYLKKGQLIGYTKKGSNIKPKIVNTCNKK